MTSLESPASSELSLNADTKPVGRLHRRFPFLKNVFVEWAFFLAMALLSAVLIRGYLCEAFYIPSESMENTLLKGDRVLVNKLSYRLHSIRRGDVVVFHKPDTAGARQYYKDERIRELIKRVVALPGDTIESKNTDGVMAILVNGKQLDEKYVKSGSNQGVALERQAVIPKQVIPEGTVYVMGDNRSSSEDSRFVGPIPISDVIGRAFVIMWPLDSLKSL